MKEEYYTYWGRGWGDYWNGKKQTDCPTYPEQEKRDEWMLGWLSAQTMSQWETELHEEPQ